MSCIHSRKRDIFILWLRTLTFYYDLRIRPLGKVRKNQLARYLGQTSFTGSLKVIVSDTQTHTGSIAVAGPLVVVSIDKRSDTATLFCVETATRCNLYLNSHESSLFPSVVVWNSRLHVYYKLSHIALQIFRSCHAHSPPLFRPRLPCSYLAKSRPHPGCLPVTLSPPDSGLTR